MYDWIISDSVSFNRRESYRIRTLKEYANPRTKRFMLSHRTVSRTISSIYDRLLGNVTKELARAASRTTFSIDLWTSQNKLSILGLVAHFINSSGKPI